MQYFKSYKGFWVSGLGNMFVSLLAAFADGTRGRFSKRIQLSNGIPELFWINKANDSYRHGKVSKDLSDISINTPQKTTLKSDYF